MTVNLTEIGLNKIVNNFDLFYIDIWGVLHNGITLNKEAVNVLSKLDELGKEYILLTNAPRPNLDVIKFLNKLGLDDKKSSKVYTSGQGSLNYLNNKKKGVKNDKNTKCKGNKFIHTQTREIKYAFKAIKRKSME